MTGPEVLDVSRDAIFTLVVMSSTRDVGRACSRPSHFVIAGPHANPGNDFRFSYQKYSRSSFSLIVALPFMAEKMHAEMLRIAASIVSG